jgi:hypothetical protein
MVVMGVFLIVAVLSVGNLYLQLHSRRRKSRNHARRRRRCTAMLELIICSMLTILPDYLYRRYVQGKRIGKEITFFSVWFELRLRIQALLLPIKTLVLSGH